LPPWPNHASPSVVLPGCPIYSQIPPLSAYASLTLMIGRLTGIILDKSLAMVCIDVQGVGYEVDVRMSTLYSLPDTGAKVSLLTHLIVREDAHILYGFGTAAERQAFRQLIRITGVGARMALAVLSGMTVAELSQVVTLQEAGR